MRSKLIAWGQGVGNAPEKPPGNCVEAVRYARALGFDGIEIDLQVSRDGVVIAHHDDTLERETDGTGVVTSKTFEELSALSRGTWEGQVVRIAPFEKVLAEAAGFSVIADARLPTPRSIKLLAEAVERSGFDQASLIVSAYSVEHGLQVKSALPAASVVVKTYEAPEKYDGPGMAQKIAAAGLEGAMLNVPPQSPAIASVAQAMHDANLCVVSFLHHSDLWSLQQLVNARVDYILTIHPGMREKIKWPE